LVLIMKRRAGLVVTPGGVIAASIAGSPDLG
jgi:hypothetical protein